MAFTLSRRNFFGLGRAPSNRRIRPPGVSADDMLECSGCGSCVEICPTHIIALVDELPALDFYRGECTFCGECARVCPEQVFKSAVPKRFGHVATIGDACLARNSVECQSCRDSCPNDAICFLPQAGGPFLPALDEEACNGCGACVSICPAAAISMRGFSMETAHA